ncbi:MAG: hypothetical protein GY778_17270, partial [bacterium]|nr:hypothetical protein [bacterium]
VVCPGACCFGDASCLDFLTPADCSAQGGTFQGEETTCAGVTCPLCSYCPSSYTDDGGPGDADDAITNVTFNTINNTTGPEVGNLSYGDYTAISTAVAPGAMYTVFVTVDSCVDAGPWIQHVWVWIDWNQNCVLDDAGEAYDLGDNGEVCLATLQLDITVPLDALPGTTRMRVIEQFFTDPEPCDADAGHTATYGETEDYTIMVAGGDPGACCMPDESCVDGQDAVDCITAGGRFQGAGVLCTAVDCTIIGACCDPTDGTCSEIGPTACAAAGGTYHGDFSTCAAV